MQGEGTNDQRGRAARRGGAWWLGLSLLAGCYEGSSADPAEGDSGGADASSSDDGGSTGDEIPEDLDPRSVPESFAVRLTDTQYANTVHDVLGVELDEQELGWLPRDVPIEGRYSSSAEGQFFNSQYVLAYAYIARSLSDRLDPVELLQTHAGCDDPDDDGCIEAFIAGLGRRAFRRPLTADEHAALATLAATIAADPNTSGEHVVHGLLQAMLQAPPFLYRLEGEREGEPGQLRRASGWELASRLSYFLWQSAPDEELLAFAAGPDGDGEYDGQALPDQLERMIADPRFARTRRQFWGDYTLASVAAFGGVDAALGEDLRESLLATLDRISGVGAEPRPLSDLLDGDELVMTPAVAELAGATPHGEGLQVYTVDEAEERRGVVTHPAFLAAMGTTSFVGRGVFMTARLLCQHTAAPPSDDGTAMRIEDTANATTDMTPREASEFRFGLEPVCLGCHTQFEPIAYAFERYDMGGRFTLTDEQGRALYSNGTLPAFGDRPELAFESAPELLEQLAGRPELRGCLVDNMTEYAWGARPVLAMDFLEESLAHYEDEGQTFDALVRAVAASERLTLLRTVEEP